MNSAAQWILAFDIEPLNTNWNFDLGVEILLCDILLIAMIMKAKWNEIASSFLSGIEEIILVVRVNLWIFHSGFLFPALLSVTSLFYVLSIVFVALLYTYYTKPDGCTENKFFISINLILCVVISVISIHPRIQVCFSPPASCCERLHRCKAYKLAVWYIACVWAHPLSPLKAP